MKALQFSRRLLDSDPCILDHVSTDHFNENEEAYCLWFDSKEQLLSVSNKRLPSCDTLLRLTLRNNQGDSDKTVEDENHNSNVGTKLLHQDSLLNVWEFRLAPQESCQFHVHKLRYFFTNLTESTTQALDEKGAESGVPNHQKRGQTIYVDEESLGSHAVQNVGSTVFLQFIVEFKF
jgi:hypothetical protein